MAIKKILTEPDPFLREKSKKVEIVNDEIRSLMDDMLDTMYAAPGIGLAATQVDFHERIILVDISEEKNSLIVLINPEITESDGRQEYKEGCLSVPTVFEKVERYERIKVRALDQKGNPFEIETEGLLSVCIQHEIDHLDGKVFVDYLSPLKKNRIKTKLIKALKNK